MASIGSHVYVHSAKTVVKTVHDNSKCFEVKVYAARFSIKSIVICDFRGSQM